MDAYTTHMSLYTSDDAVLCRMFPTSLKRGTLSWFTKLPTNFVDCFETVVSKFETQFTTSRTHHLTSITLVRFGKVAMNIQNLSPDVAMHHMLTALRPGPFVDSLCMQPTTSLDELGRESPSLCSWRS